MSRLKVRLCGLPLVGVAQDVVNRERKVLSRQPRPGTQEARRREELSRGNHREARQGDDGEKWLGRRAEAPNALEMDRVHERNGIDHRPGRLRQQGRGR